MADERKRTEADIRDAAARLRERQAERQGRAPEARQTPGEFEDREQNVQSGDPALREELEEAGRSRGGIDGGEVETRRIEPSHVVD